MAVINGDDTSQLLLGNDGEADNISGLGGNDTLKGLGGDDTINGGTGNDQIEGAAGADFLIGDVGDDSLDGGDGNDLVNGGEGNDSLQGGADNDTLKGVGGNDAIDGGAGDDQIEGAEGNDSLVGGADNDQIDGGAGIDTVEGGLGNDSLQGGDDNDFLSGGDGDDSMDGGTGNDQLTGGAGGDTLEGGEGDDNLQGGIGNDSLTGSNGNDLLSGGDGADTLKGVAGADNIAGGLGDDLLVGGPDNDILDGTDGIDTSVYFGDQNSYTLEISNNQVFIEDRRADGDGRDELINLDILRFAGGSVFDDGVGDVETDFNLNTFANFASLSQDAFNDFVQLYIAYFNRAPDAVGLYFWGTVLANGSLTLEQIADDFFTQPETLAAYPDLSDNAAFAGQVYQNVLGRPFDQAGLDFWVGVLDSGTVTQSQFILQFLEGVNSGGADAAYLADKTDLGIYSSVILGMSNATNAADNMALYDGSGASIVAAKAAIDADYAAALDPDNGEFLMQLVGVVNDPFVI